MGAIYRTADIELIETAVKIQKLAEEKSFAKVIEAFDAIYVLENGVLGIIPGMDSPLAEESYVTVTLPNGKVIRDEKNSDFWAYIFPQLSLMGLWQTYLLKNLWTYMPLWGHKAYNRLTYIYYQEKLLQLLADKKKYTSVRPIQGLNIDNLDVSPKFELKGETAVFSVCLWSDFAGLIREVYQVRHNAFGTPDVKYISHEVLFEYNCGIVY